MKLESSTRYFVEKVGQLLQPNCHVRKFSHMADYTVLFCKKQILFNVFNALQPAICEAVGFDSIPQKWLLSQPSKSADATDPYPTEIMVPSVHQQWTACYDAVQLLLVNLLQLPELNCHQNFWAVQVIF